jgi:hypothetical protein
MRLTKTKIASVLAVIAVVALGGTAAMAYWTTTGSGTGSAAAGTTQTLTVRQTSSVAGLYPGGPSVDLSGNFYNPNVGPAHVTTVTAGAITVTKAVGAPAGSCDGTDFQITGTGTVVDSSVPASATATDYQGSWSGLSISMVNASTNQDGCKGATLSIAYTVA